MLLIKNGRVIDPKSGFYGVRDIYTREGNIIEISEDIQAIGVEEIDARGLMVSPNLTAISISAKEKMSALDAVLSFGLYLVAKGHLSLMDLLKKMAIETASADYSSVSFLAEGGPENLMIFSAQEANLADHDSKMNCQISKGCVKYTIMNGKIIYHA